MVIPLKSRNHFNFVALNKCCFLFKPIIFVHSFKQSESLQHYLFTIHNISGMAAYFNLNNNEMQRTSTKDCFYLFHLKIIQQIVVTSLDYTKPRQNTKYFFKHNNFVRSNAVMYKKCFFNILINIVKFLTLHAFEISYFTPGKLGRYNVAQKSSSIERKFCLNHTNIVLLLR